MSLSRFALTIGRVAPRSTRLLSTSAPRLYADEASPKNVFPNDRKHPQSSDYGKEMKDRATGPHMTNTNSTISNEMPSVGADKAPPEFLSFVDKEFTPKDAQPENTERMTGGTQKGSPDSGANAELDVGEIEGVDFKVEPNRRSGEDANTMRARLLYQSRKRGTLESDLLLSTFADANLASMSRSALEQYDHFLDENDWDIYYWTTQTATPTSHETAEGGLPAFTTPNARGKEMSGSEPSESKSEPKLETDHWRNGQARSGEWAQTVGAFKPAYRPVPARWKNSEILAKLRKHVIDRSAGGVHEDSNPQVQGEGLAQGVKGSGGGGLGSMPEVKNFDV